MKSIEMCDSGCQLGGARTPSKQNKKQNGGGIYDNIAKYWEDKKNGKQNQIKEKDQAYQKGFRDGIQYVLKQFKK